MSASIVPQLVRKDMRLMSRTIAMFGLVSLVCIGILGAMYEHVPTWMLLNMGFLLLVSPVGTCGIVILMKTNVFEKEKSTQPFIMSLPVTVKEFTRAKLLVNLPLFAIPWLVISAIGFYFAFGLGLFPLSTVPFAAMIFLGGFLAYTVILCVSLMFQSLGITVLTIAIVEMGTSGYLSTIAYLDPIAHHVAGSNVVWNSAAIAIAGAQIGIAILLIVATMLVQNMKRDFI
ncbi:MAG: ABC-2 transporter permease [Sphingomonas bacterium]